MGLVGPNGAGKTTLLHLAVGLLAADGGHDRGAGRARSRAVQRSWAGVGFVAQETPVYAALTVADHLRLGAHLNPGWDRRLAEDRIARLGLDPEQRAGQLSGGQRAQLALTLAVAKRPDLLLLDEPVASLDPLARREFLQSLMEIAVEHEVSVVLSSHLVADLERVCDYLIVLAAAHVQLAGEVDDLLATHRRLVGPRKDPATLPGSQQVIEASHTDRQSTLLVRTKEPIHDPAWTVEEVSARRPGARLHGTSRQRRCRCRRRRRPPYGGALMIWLAWRQFRVQAVVALALLVALAVVMLVTGLHLRDLYDASGIATCKVHGDCATVEATFLAHESFLRNLLGPLLLAIPVLTGIFWGAPLLARELENGTYRLAWTQSVTRTRWLATKITLVGLASIAVAGLFSLMVSWWFHPIDKVSMNRLTPGVFDERGIVAIGYAALAFALAVAAGAVIRRTLPAMATTRPRFRRCPADHDLLDTTASDRPGAHNHDSGIRSQPGV